MITRLWWSIWLALRPPFNGGGHIVTGRTFKVTTPGIFDVYVVHGDDGYLKIFTEPELEAAFDEPV